MEEQNAEGTVDNSIPVDSQPTDEEKQNTEELPEQQVSKESNEDEEYVEEVEEKLPFDKHPRWQKKVKKIKELESELESYRNLSQQFGSEEDIYNSLSLQQALKSNPYAAQVLYDLLSNNPKAALQRLIGNEEGEQSEDPYSDYDEATAAKFKELDELKQWKNQLEEGQKSAQEKYIEQYQTDLEYEFDQRLKNDGFLDDQGREKDKITVDLISNAMTAWIQNNSENPSAPTPQEFDAGYKIIKESYDVLKNKIKQDLLNEEVENPPPPASGSNRGIAPPEKNTGGDEMSRVMDLANSL